MDSKHDDAGELQANQWFGTENVACTFVPCAIPATCFRDEERDLMFITCATSGTNLVLSRNVEVDYYAKLQNPNCFKNYWSCTRTPETAWLELKSASKSYRWRRFYITASAPVMTIFMQLCRHHSIRAEWDMTTWRFDVSCDRVAARQCDLVIRGYAFQTIALPKGLLTQLTDTY